MLAQFVASAIAPIIFLSGRRFSLSFWEKAIFAPIIGVASTTFLSVSLARIGLPLSSALSISSAILFTASILAFLSDEKKFPAPPETPKSNAPLLVFLIALSAVLALFSNFNYSAIGTDATRFSYISEAAYLTDSVPMSLHPYDIVDSYFYFPVPLFYPAFFAYMGISPLTALTYLAILFSALSAVSFFYFAKEAFPEKGSSIPPLSAFAYLLAFNIPLGYFAGRGIFAYLLAWHSFISGAFLILRLGRNPEDREGTALVFFSVLGILLTHWYLIFGLALVFLSVSASIAKERRFSFTKRIAAPVLIATLLSFALLYGFLASSGNPLSSQKTSGWKYGEYEVEENSWEYSALSGIAKDPALGPIFQDFSLAYLVGLSLIFAYLISGKFPKSLRLFFFSVLLLSILLSRSLTHKRVIDYLRILYPLGIGIFLAASSRFRFRTRTVLQGFLICALIFSPFSTAWVLGNIPFSDERSFDIVTDGEIKAFEYIAANVSRSAVFLIDGPGAGCVGGQSGSHGERIFPLTGRRVFLFTNYCWANYREEEFARRIDLYRRLSINPGDETVLATLKDEYGVTHIYIGPVSVGLDPERLRISGKYSSIFRTMDGVEIFEISGA